MIKASKSTNIDILYLINYKYIVEYYESSIGINEKEEFCRQIIQDLVAAYRERNKEVLDTSLEIALKHGHLFDEEQRSALAKVISAFIQS